MKDLNWFWCGIWS